MYLSNKEFKSCTKKGYTTPENTDLCLMVASGRKMFGCGFLGGLSSADPWTLRETDFG